MDEDQLRELFASIGPIAIRRLFGGQRIYADGTIVALVLRGQLYFKGDDEVGGLYEKAGAVRWRYARKDGRPASIPYWTAPDAIFDDPDEAELWCSVALEASRRVERAKAKAG